MDMNISRPVFNENIIYSLRSGQGCDLVFFSLRKELSSFFFSLSPKNHLPRLPWKCALKTYAAASLKILSSFQIHKQVQPITQLTVQEGIKLENKLLLLKF